MHVYVLHSTLNVFSASSVAIQIDDIVHVVEQHLNELLIYA